MDRDRIVILMAAWNGERYLAEQLDSILAQDWPNWRLVVQDDNSQDATPQILSAYAERYPDKIAVRRNLRNMGATGNFLALLEEAVSNSSVFSGGAAVNSPAFSDEAAVNSPAFSGGAAVSSPAFSGEAAVNSPAFSGGAAVTSPAFSDEAAVNSPMLSKGAAADSLMFSEKVRKRADRTYYMFADQDDIWRPDKVRRTLRRMKRLEARYGEETPALVFTDAKVVDEKGTHRADSFCALQHLNAENRSLSHLLMENVCQGCTMLLNGALAGRIRLPETDAGRRAIRYHDWWTALTAAAFGHISFLPEPTMQYRLHGNNVVGASSFGNYVRRRAADRKEQRRALQATWQQAEAFRACYGQELSGRKKELVDAFCRMPQAKPAVRCGLLLKYRFYKSGLVRNIGLLLNLLK